MKLSRFILPCVLLLAQHANAEDALAKYLRTEAKVSVVPNHFSYWVPGGIIILRSSAPPDYRDPVNSISSLPLSPASSLFNQNNKALTVDGGVVASVLNGLFGSSAGVAVSGSTSVDFKGMKGEGWRLDSNQMATVGAENSDTYNEVVNDLWKKAGLLRDSKLYLIEAVFSATGATIVTRRGGAISIGPNALASEGCKTDAAGQGGAAGKDENKDKPAGTQAGKNGSQQAAPAANPATPAVGQAADSAPMTIAKLKDQVTKATENVANTKIELGGCSANTVGFADPNPIPTAMLVRRILLPPSGPLVFKSELIKF